MWQRMAKTKVIFSLITLFMHALSYECPRIKNHFSSKADETYTQVISIDGSNMILAQSTSTTDAQTFLTLFDLSSNSCIQQKDINDKINSMAFSKSQNMFLTFLSNLQRRDVQLFNVQQSFPSTDMIGSTKSSIDDSQMIMYSKTFTSQYFDLTTGQGLGTSYPITPTTTSDILSYSCKDVQLKDFQVLAQFGAGRIDLYEVTTRNLIISKIYTGTDQADLAVMAGIANSNLLAVSLGTSQLYLWEVKWNSTLKKLEIFETISINLIRYIPIELDSFIGLNGDSYLIIFSGTNEVDIQFNTITPTYRDIILYHYLSAITSLEIIEAYPFTSLKNSNNWQVGTAASQISISDATRLMSAATFLPESLRVYGFSFDAHYIFPLLESSTKSQCDFDLDGNIDDYCRLPILINKNNLEIDKAFFILNDGNLFIANNEQSGFSIISSNDLTTQTTIIPSRMYERCLNCVQRMRQYLSSNSNINTNQSSNINESQNDDVIVFGKRYRIEEMASSSQKDWQSNQGIYIYNYTKQQLTSVDLSTAMSTPNYKLYLSWQLVITYTTANNLIYSCLAYQLPISTNIQSSYYTDQTQIHTLQSYFNQHSMECYIINADDTFVQLLIPSYPAAIDYTHATPLSFQQTCEVSYSTNELICMNGIDQLNVWSLDTLIWKKRATIPQCVSAQRVFTYSYSSRPYLFIICPLKISIVDLTNISNIFSILTNTQIEDALISKSILYVQSGMEILFCDIDTALINSSDCKLLGHFYDISSTSQIISMDYITTTSSLYFANQQIIFSINNIDPTFFNQSNTSCDSNIFISQNQQNNLIAQKQALIQQNKVGYPLSYGQGTLTSPFQNTYQVVEGLYAYEILNSSINFSIGGRNNFQINFNINLDYSKQNVLVDQLFTWSISNNLIRIIPYNALPTQRSIALVSQESLTISNWTNFEFQSIQFVLIQPLTNNMTVDLSVQNAIQAIITNVNLHQIPGLQSNKQMIIKSLMQFQNCSSVIVDSYSIDSYNITSTMPLFSFDASQDIQISNLVISNCFIEQSVILNSQESTSFIISKSKIQKNSFCSYNLYKKYIQQLNITSDIYSAITFKENIQITNLDISNNQFCTNTNLISGSSANLIIGTNSNVIILDTILFTSNQYISGAQLQNLLYSFTLTQTGGEPLITTQISGVQIQLNQLTQIDLPWKIDPPTPSTSNTASAQSHILQKQVQSCNYFQINYILSIDMNTSFINNESICGMIELSQVYQIKLTSLELNNDDRNQVIQNARNDPMISISESNEIAIQKIKLSNQYFVDTIGIKVSLEEFIGQSIDINNNEFLNVKLLSSQHYIQVNLIYLTLGYSQLQININNNTFEQVTVSFSTSSQTLSSSCIASNSLVSDIVMKNNTFNDTYSDSINGAVVLNARSISIMSSTFSNNLFTQINLPTLSQDIQVNGGFIKATTKQITIQDTTFTDGVAQLGMLYITPSDKTINVQIINCNFINLLAFSSGTALYLQGSQSLFNLQITNSLFSNIYLDSSSNYKADLKAVLHIETNQNADITNNLINLTNLTLENISGIQSFSNPSYFFSSGQSQITVNQITITRFIVDAKAYQRLFVTLMLSNNIQIYSSVFSIFSNSLLQLSNLSIDEPNILDLIHTLQSPDIIHPALVSILSGSTLIVSNVNMTQLQLNYQGGIIYAENSPNIQLTQFIATAVNLLLDSSIQIVDNIPFNNIWNSLLNFKGVASIVIDSSSIDCGEQMDVSTKKLIPQYCQGRIIQAFESNLVITDSTFNNYYTLSGNGTALALINMKGTNSLTKLTFSNIKSSQNAGAIFVYNNFNTLINDQFTLNINKCTFYNNTAVKLGGVLAFENDPQNKQIQTIQLDISESVFEQNNAKIAGCIYYNNFIPTISDTSNTFTNNQASMGNIIFSQPRIAKLVPSTDIEETELTANNQYNFLARNNTAIQILHASGQKLPTLSFKLYFYDSPSETQTGQSEKEVQINLLNLENLASQVVVLLENYPFVQQSKTIQPFALQGSTNIFFNETGNFIYLNMNIWSEPKADLNLNIIFSLVKQIDRQSKSILPSYQYVSQIYIRNCTKFETISEPQNIPTINLSPKVNQCNKCPSLTFAYEQAICQECPQGSTCQQDAELIISQQYWRRSFDTFEILSCDNNFNSCQGGTTVGDNLCVEGYIGALCQECDLFAQHWQDSYGKQGQYLCMKCDEMVLSYFILLFLTSITIALAIISINSNAFIIYKKIAHTLVQKFKKIKKIRNRQLSNQNCDDSVQRQEVEVEEEEEKVLQQSSGAYFKILTSYFQVLGSLSSFHINVPSFFPQVSSSLGNPIKVSLQSMDCLLKDNSYTIPYHFYKFILSLTLPVWYYIIVLTILFLKSKIKKERFQQNYFYSAAVFLFVYLQPDLVQQAINLGSCVQIGSMSYILSDLNSFCYEREHITYIIYLIIPSILVLLLIIPMKLFLLLRRNKSMLERINFRIRWAFLYHEYTSKNYAWEFVKMYEKLIIVIVLSIFNSQHNVKASLMIIILIVYTFLLLKNKPFTEQIDNQIELYASVSCIITIVLVILIIQNQINSIIQLLAMSSMLLVNLFTISIILLRILMRFYQGLVINKSKFLTLYPNLAKQLQKFFEIVNKYLFFHQKIFKIDAAEHMHQQLQSIHLKQDSKQPIIMQLQSFNNNNNNSIQNNSQNINQSSIQNQPIDQSIFNVTSNNQQWYQKYRSSQYKQINKSNAISDNPKQNLPIIKKAKAGISLNKILNYSIQPHPNNISSKQPNQQQSDNNHDNNKNTNIFYKRSSQQDHIQNERIKELENIDSKQNYLSQYSPALSPLNFNQKHDGQQLLIHDKNEDNENEQNYNFEDQKEIFIISDNDINFSIPISPTVSKQLGGLQQYSQSNQLFFK